MALSQNCIVNYWLFFFKDNCICPDGGASIGEGLKSNTSLMYLNLAANSIGSCGHNSIMKALEMNTKLTKLFIDYFPISRVPIRAKTRVQTVDKPIVKEVVDDREEDVKINRIKNLQDAEKITKRFK